MVIAISLLTAVIFGSGDFCGGIAAKRTSILQVVAGSHFVGFIGVAALALILHPPLRADDLLLGAAGGAFGGIGVGFLYRRLAVGPMHVVAPMTAITAAVVPTAWGFIAGDELSALVWAGIALGLVAIGLVSSSSSDRHAPVTLAVVAESLLSGAGFGAFFILLDATNEVSAPWPVVSARLFTTTILICFLVIKRQPIVNRDAATVGLLIATGLFDVAANLGFLYAVLRGDLAVVSVLTSLYPISTIVLARFTLGERMTGVQGWGVIGALGATTLIAAG